MKNSFGISNKLSKREKSVALQCYMMLAFPIIGFVVFTAYPILWTFRWSLFSYTGATKTAIFVGLDNFKTMFSTDFTYWRMWLTTIILAILKMPAEITLAMILALMLNRVKRFSGVFRSIYYLPSIISVAVIGLIFSNMFSYFGLVNTWLMKLGILSAPIDWFASRTCAFTMITISSIWNTFGINVMYLLAALSNVPLEVYESAKLDGADGYTKFFKITLPLIAPVFQTILLLSLIGTLSLNELVIVLTNGAPSGQSNTVMSYITSHFIPGFISSQGKVPIGYGCAMSVITTIIFGIVAYLYNKVSKKMSEMY